MLVIPFFKMNLLMMNDGSLYYMIGCLFKKLKVKSEKVLYFPLKNLKGEQLKNTFKYLGFLT